MIGICFKLHESTFIVLLRHSSETILTSDSVSSHIIRNVSIARPRNLGKSGVALKHTIKHYQTQLGEI